ncbi:hypothetical protein SUNI508_13519 [Seiridium unicorne]|uniref:Uncharacterized protein n=1 Tax=Seiridium unicorne TaxID=138068 RepID=A0ABR2VDX6_9PEZI
MATFGMAGPIQSRALTNVTSVANFDRFPCSTPSKLGIEVRQNLRTYQVFLGRMYLLQPGLKNGSVTIGAVPSSGRNVAAYVQTTDPFIVPFITTPPGRTNVTSFDVESFSFGCVYGSGGGTAQGVSSCSVIVSGFSNGRNVASQQFEYRPGRVVKANMTAARLKAAFKNLDRVEFTTIYPTSVQQNGATYLDDIKHTVHER